MLGKFIKNKRQSKICQWELLFFFFWQKLLFEWANSEIKKHFWNIMILVWCFKEIKLIKNIIKAEGWINYISCFSYICTFRLLHSVKIVFTSIPKKSVDMYQYLMLATFRSLLMEWAVAISLAWVTLNLSIERRNSNWHIDKKDTIQQNSSLLVF